MTDSNTFHQTIVDQMTEAREIIRQAVEDCGINHVQISITCSGRVLDGGMRITYGVGEYSPEVSAADFHDAIYEFLRRKGWTKKHEPTMIEDHRPKSSRLDDEVPY